MPCCQESELLLQYLWNQLKPEEEKKLREHLIQCFDCRERLVYLREADIQIRDEFEKNRSRKQNLRQKKFFST